MREDIFRLQKKDKIHLGYRYSETIDLRQLIRDRGIIIQDKYLKF